MGLLDNIKQYCSKADMTIAELETKAGIAHNYMFKWNTVIPNVDKVQRVAKALGVSVEDLMEE